MDYLHKEFNWPKEKHKLEKPDEIAFAIAGQPNQQQQQPIMNIYPTPLRSVSLYTFIHTGNLWKKIHSNDFT